MQMPIGTKAIKMNIRPIDLGFLTGLLIAAIIGIYTYWPEIKKIWKRQ